MTRPAESLFVAGHISNCIMGTMLNRPLAIILTAVLLIAGLASTTAADDPFTLDNLLGSWDAVGWVIFPMVGAKMDIDGNLSVAHDSTGRNYVTVLSAEKFMVSYSANGLVVPDTDSDSLTWTVRDSFKRTVQYRGLVTDAGISGSMEYGKRTYSFSLAETSIDTMHVVLHRRHTETAETEQIGELVLTPSVAGAK